MDGQIIARKRPVSSLLLQYQVFFMYFTEKEPWPWGKKGKKILDAKII